MNFLETMFLYEGAVKLGSIPNQGAWSCGANSNKVLPLTSWRVFRLPNRSPRCLWFGDPVPPYSGSHCIVSLERISKS